MTRLKLWCQRINPTSGATVVFFAAPLVAWVAYWNVGNAVVFGTGVVVLAYTYETYQMRKQMVRQTGEMQAQREFQLHPLVVLDLEKIPGDENCFFVRNVGHGAALDVTCTIQEAERNDGRRKGRKKPECYTVAVVPAHDSKQLFDREFETRAPFPITGSANNSYEVTIAYKNIEGNPYKTRI